MKKTLVAVLSAVLALALVSTGCVAVSFTSHGRRGTVQGEGEMVAVDFPCGDFTGVTVKTAGILYYTAEKSDKVTIELQESLAQYITVSNNNGMLVIDSEKEFDTNFGDEKNAPKIYVSSPSLEKLLIDGAIEVKKADKITSNTFELEVMGVCTGTFDLEVQELKVDLSGVGETTLNGTADKAWLETSGVGNIKAFGLQTKEADVTTSGVGGVEISCSDKLVAEVSGIGGIKYKGNPSVTPDVTGMGGLSKVE